MDKYKVLYRSEGLLSGKEPGDTVELDSVDGKHLEALGTVEKVKAAPAAKAESKPDTSKPATPKPDAKPASKPAAKAESK